MSIDQYLTATRSDQTGFLTITLDRRDNPRNQLNTGMILALHEVLFPELLQPSCRGVLLRSAQVKLFSLGADIDGELQELDAYGASRFCAVGKEVFNLLARLSCPTVALLSGFALGGGLELALCCDFRIAAQNVRLGLPEINLAIIPGWGGTQRLPRLIGRSRALSMILQGDPLNAADALACGLVDQLVDTPDDLLPAGEKLLEKLATKSPSAVALAKRAVYEGGDLPLSHGLELESEVFGLAWSTADRQEGLAAYREKRKPQWKK